MLNVGDNVLIKGKIVRIEKDCDNDNQIIYKVKMPVMDGWDEAWFQAIDVVETKGDEYGSG